METKSPWEPTPELEAPQWPPDPDAPVDLQQLEHGNPLQKVRFQFRHQDEYALERIQGHADELFAEMFTEAIEYMNEFYACLRIPRQDRNGQVVKNNKGEVIWETDENGDPIQVWEQLVGQDLEMLYMNLEKIKIFLAPEVNKLKLQAMWAQIVVGDTKDDARKDMATGLENDKAAFANRRSKEDRYHAFFRYYLWSTADVFYSQIIDFIYKLRDVRNWRIQSQV